MENGVRSKSKQKQGPNYNCVYEDDQFLPNEEDSATYCRERRVNAPNATNSPNPICDSWVKCIGCSKVPGSIIQKQPTTGNPSMNLSDNCLGSTPIPFPLFSFDLLEKYLSSYQSSRNLRYIFFFLKALDWLFLEQDEVTQDKSVHVGTQKAPVCILRRTTIGSPLILKLVLTAGPHPVIVSNLLISL